MPSAHECVPRDCVPIALQSMLPGGEDISLPPVLASLVVAEDASGFNADLTRKAFAALRPYGGVAWLPIPAGNIQEFQQQIASDTTLVNARVQATAEGILLSRVGA